MRFQLYNVDSSFASLILSIQRQCISPKLLHNFDVVEVDAGCGGGVDDPHDSIHAHWSEEAGVLGHHLRAQRGSGAVQKSLPVTQLYRLTDGREDLHPFINRLLERLGNDGGMDSCQEKHTGSIQHESSVPFDDDIFLK